MLPSIVAREIDDINVMILFDLDVPVIRIIPIFARY